MVEKEKIVHDEGVREREKSTDFAPSPASPLLPTVIAAIATIATMD